MYRVQSPNGELLEIINAVPMCEAMVEIAEERKLVLAKAKSLELKPTAVCFQIMSEDRASAFSGLVNEHLLIGNLKPEYVRTILNKLTEEGYYNFSPMQFQGKKYINMLKIDGGDKALPYTSESLVDFGFFNPNQAGAFFVSHIPIGMGINYNPMIEQVNGYELKGEYDDDEE